MTFVFENSQSKVRTLRLARPGTSLARLGGSGLHLWMASGAAHGAAVNCNGKTFTDTNY